MPEPRLKKIRALGTPLPGLTRKRSDRKPYPPGQHGPHGQRRRSSEYKKRLEEKQKVKLNYGLSERQMRRYFYRASRGRGVTGDILFASLERRLANVVFRSGMAPTGPAARQLVSHGHVYVDGRRVDRPGYAVSIGQVITLSEKLAQNPHVLTAVERGPQVALPSYLIVSNDGLLCRMTAEPHRSDVPFIVDDRAIVEFYAR